MTPEASSSHLMDFAPDLLRLVQKPSKRADVVPLYATAIVFESFARPQQAKTSWGAVNLAIAERWSWAAVLWIKKQAWKRAHERAKILSGQQHSFDEAQSVAVDSPAVEPSKP